MPKNQAEYDKLFKIRSLIDLPKESVMREYELSSCMAKDESMIPFKGILTCILRKTIQLINENF